MRRADEALVTARVRCASRAQQVTDEQTQALAEAIEARKREVRGVRQGAAKRAPHVTAAAKARADLRPIVRARN